eukprot:scaffold3882_cov164-Amphora_coffeaeformis.AAC.12
MNLMCGKNMNKLRPCNVWRPKPYREKEERDRKGKEDDDEGEEDEAWLDAARGSAAVALTVGTSSLVLDAFKRRVVKDIMQPKVVFQYECG